MTNVYDSSPIGKTKAAKTPASDDARKMFAYLLLSAKNLSLYPEGHTISLNSIRQLHKKLEAFIGRYGDFRLDIEKDRILVQGEDVFVGPSEEGSLGFALFRDGIRWLEFTEGITLEELSDFLSILNEHQLLAGEPTGDIVTALWEAGFAHIQYEVTAYFPSRAQSGLTAISDLMARAFAPAATGPGQAGPAQSATPGAPIARASAPRSSGEKSGPAQSGTPGAQAGLGQPKGDPAIDAAALTLTEREKTWLREMIYREETAPASAHLNMLLDSLHQYPDRDSVQVILDVLTEEFSAFLSSLDFSACMTIVEGLRYIAESGRMVEPWGKAAIERELAVLASPESLRPLADIWGQIPPQQAGQVERIFQRLHPRAVESLAPLLLSRQQQALQFIVEEAILHLSGQDGQYLDALVHAADERMAARLLPLLCRLEQEASTLSLLALARHAFPAVRRLAVKAILHLRSVPAEDIFKLMDDPDEAVRRLILRQMGQARDETVEGLLLRYLQHPAIKSQPDGHILDCFKTLGRCGSVKSISFLKEALVNRKWMVGLDKSSWRAGAAQALAALNIPEADDVLAAALRSLHPGLRKLAREAGAASKRKGRRS